MNQEHGISVGITHVEEFFFMKVKLNGTLTHKDYKNMIPLLRHAIKGVEKPQVKVFIDATEFDGWELRAAWDDFMYGMEFRKAFTKIAFVGTKTWEKYGVKIGSWFVSGDVKFFASVDEAYTWLNEDEQEATTAVQKDLKSRREDIENELQDMFESNLKIVDWNVPEADDQNAAEILVEILQTKLHKIRDEVESGKYK